MAGTEYRLSRCLEPRNAPQRIVPAVIDGDERLVLNEIKQAVAQSVKPEHVQQAGLQLSALFGRVRQCLAIDPSDVRNVTRCRDLWELKLDDQAFGVHVRIYITEPANMPHDLIALHAHAKLVNGSKGKIRRQQNAAIDVAIARYMKGLPDRWGIL